MIAILPQESLEICFDPLAGCLRPRWEIGPSQFQPESRDQIEQNMCPPLTAIHGHIFYVEQLNELLDFGNNIPNRYYLLNTSTTWKANLIRKIPNHGGKKL